MATPGPGREAPHAGEGESRRVIGVDIVGEGEVEGREVEANGGPLAVTIAGANVPDAKVLAETIEAVVLERPPIEEGRPQHLCLDRGYDNEDGRGSCDDYEYETHIALLCDERPSRPKQHPARRWVGGRTLAWLSKCRVILIRQDKKRENYLGLLKLACILLWVRRYHRLTVVE